MNMTDELIVKGNRNGRTREVKENRTGTGHVLENVSDPDDNGVYCKSDRNNLQFLHSRYETTDHTLRDMPADDRDHRHCRMDYEKGASTGGLDLINTCMVRISLFVLLLR